MKDKMNTEGMFVRSIAGDKMSKEDVLTLIEIVKSGEAKGGNIISDYMYYSFNNSLIKYNYETLQAFVLNSDQKWQFDENLTQLLFTNPQALPRVYNVYEDYEFSEVNPRKSK